ncbi:MAG TPA: MBL fold metallo-hydrolase [Candidatus Moranbacteria bacterium]|nr:MBL fold metallo-hydrolase [Candidatus Moranbacteria bacterium]HRY28079.1 MBL fold metallo-hydrolase [Candidatus Moranbacteria bacterium]HSA08573.1 MBL fold metallo-hydrolase [Candidatus Moranbacteria bacterium]
MKLIFLGTNSWYSDNGSNTICTLLETEKNYIVFDAGDGLHKLDKFIKKPKPIILFVSHLHLDHIIGFHVFPKFKFNNDLTIICPKGTKKNLKKIVNSPFTAPLNERSFKVMVKEAAEGKHKSPVNFECRKIFHADLCFGYRLSVGKKNIAYLCDTGECENFGILAKDADVVITEGTLPVGFSNKKWGHLNPEEAAHLVKKSGAKKLVLTHFIPEYYNSDAKKNGAEKAARKIFENTICAKDNLVLKV